jgi:hypothetical protein
VLADGLTFPYPLPDEMPLYNIPDDGIMLDLPRNYHPGNIVFHEGKFYERQRRFYKLLSLGGGSGLPSRISSACQLLDTYDDYITALAQETPEKRRFGQSLKSCWPRTSKPMGFPMKMRICERYSNSITACTNLPRW